MTGAQRPLLHSSAASCSLTTLMARVGAAERRAAPTEAPRLQHLPTALPATPMALAGGKQTANQQPPMTGHSTENDCSRMDRTQRL